jgi:hypothetical protein
MLLFAFSNISLADNSQKKVEVDIGINREHRDVGLKRLELLDKTLSRDLIERKRELVHDIEKDYNKKIIMLIDSIIPPIFDNKVITHIDVNFFDPDFESQIRASQKISVSLILKRDGLDTWAEQNSSKEEALSTIKQIISSTFKISDKNISVLLVN